MVKSPTQEKLEAQRNQDIREIVAGALERFRGRKNLLPLVAVDLGVSGMTVYRWCEDLGINIDEYRRPADPAGAETHDRSSE